MTVGPGFDTGVMVVGSTNPAVTGCNMLMTRTIVTGGWTGVFAEGCNGASAALPVVLEMGSNDAASGNTVWVTSYDEGTVRRLDTASGAQRGAPIKVGPHPRAIAAGGGTAWVTSRDDGTVRRLRDGKTVKVGADPRDLVVADGSVWVASARDGTVTRIDAATAKAAEPIEAGEDPIGIAVGGGSVWTTNFRADTVTRTPA